MLKTIFVLALLQLVAVSAHAFGSSNLNTIKRFEGAYRLSKPANPYCPQTGKIEIKIDSAAKMLTETMTGYVYDGSMPDQNGAVQIDLDPSHHTEQPCLTCRREYRNVLQGNKVVEQEREIPGAIFWKADSTSTEFNADGSVMIPFEAMPCTFVRVD